MAKNNNLGDFLTDIANAIRTKKGTSGIIPAQNFSSEILSIQGGGEVDEYFYYSKSYYTITNNATLFPNAWQDSQNSKTVLYDIPLMLVAQSVDMGGMFVDLYVGTNSELAQLYNDCVNEVIPLPLVGNFGDIYLLNNVAVKYYGDISADVGFPIPLYEFGSMEDLSGFIIGDLTPLGMGLGITLAKIAGVPIPSNNIIIQQGFEFENESGIIIPDSVTSIGDRAFYNWELNNQPLVIPDSVTSIGDGAFRNWTANNQPLVIPDSVTSIGDGAFRNWTANNQPLVIPDSVTSIGNDAFYYWESNNQPLVIPNSVTSIGEWAFGHWQLNNRPLVIPDSVTSIGGYAFNNWQLVPYVEIKAITPPSLSSSNAFGGQGNTPIYVPHDSVTAYKNATNWSALSSRIFSIEEL